MPFFFPFLPHNYDGPCCISVSNRLTREKMDHNKEKHNRSNHSDDAHSPDVTPSLQILKWFIAYIGFSILRP